MKRDQLGWVILGASCCIGLATLPWGNTVFVDEADNLVVGSLLTRGWALYSDIFSHHFPFPYYWVALVFSLTGKSVLVARLSLLVFQIVSFGIAMRLSGYTLCLSLTSLIWSILRPLYSGNLLLYNAFCAASLVVVFAACLALLTGKTKATSGHLAAIGVFSAISMLCDPLSVYAVGIGLLCLLANNWKQGAVALLFTALPVSSYALYLQTSGTLNDFVNNALLFNSQVYSKYSYAEPLRIRDLWDMAVRGLDVLDGIWLNADPFKTINLGQYTEFDRWLFTGLLYRLALIATAIRFALMRQLRPAVFVYLWAAALLVISPWDFRGQPFTMAALIAVSALITHEFWGSERNQAGRAVHVATSLLVGLMTIWLLVRAGTYLLANRVAAQPETQFAGIAQESVRLKGLACGQVDVRLAYYPGNPYYYWFTDMKPVSRYIFMWPWVAEVGLSEVLHELGGPQMLAIVVRQDALIWGRYDTRQYLRPLDVFLESNYVRVTADTFISPLLSARCKEGGS
jgi:hypothetical protein